MTVVQTRPVRFMRHDASERPFIVIWEVTRACQLVCTHCRADAIRTRNPLELTTDEGRHLLDDLASFGTPRPLVVLTGGDPSGAGRVWPRVDCGPHEMAKQEPGKDQSSPRKRAPSGTKVPCSAELPRRPSVTNAQARRMMRSQCSSPDSQ